MATTSTLPPLKPNLLPLRNSPLPPLPQSASAPPSLHQQSATAPPQPTGSLRPPTSSVHHAPPSTTPFNRPTPAPPLRHSRGKTIYDRNLARTRTSELSRASFSYLFSEMVRYAQARVTGIQDLERRLNEAGYPLGTRLLPLLLSRSSHSSPSPRPLTVLPLLTLLSQQLWRHLFSRPADSVERSTDPAKPNEYMISDNEPLCNLHVGVPKEMGNFNAAAFVAGVVEGVCEGAGFECRCSAHNGEGGEMWPGKTVFLLAFGEGVVGREGGR